MINAEQARQLVKDVIEQEIKLREERERRRKKEKEDHIKLVREVHIPELVVPRMWKEIEEAAQQGRQRISFDVGYSTEITGTDVDIYLYNLLETNGYTVQMYEIPHITNSNSEYGSRGIKISW